MKLVQKFILQQSNIHIAKVPQKEKTVTLATLHSRLNIDNEVVNINPLILFSRLIFLADSGEETTP